MPRTVADVSLLTPQVYAAVVAGVAPALVGLGQVPTPPSNADTHGLEDQPFYVLTAIPSGGRVFAGDGYTGEPEASIIQRYQIDCVGIQWDAAEHGAHKAMVALLDADLVVSGHSIIWKRRAGSTPVQAEATVQAGQLVDIAFQATT